MKPPPSADVTRRQKAFGRRRLWSLLLFGWAGFIFVTSCTVVLPQELFGLVQYFTGLDAESIKRFEAFWGAAWVLFVKGWHFTEFAVLTVLCALALRWWSGSKTARPIFIAMALCILYAISDEWHQSFVPQRRGTVEDVLIDSLGVGVAGGLLLLRHHRRAP